MAAAKPQITTDPALVAAQQQQTALVAQQQQQADAAQTLQIKSTLGDATLQLARMFGANTMSGSGMSPLVGGTAAVR